MKRSRVLFVLVLIAAAIVPVSTRSQGLRITIAPKISFEPAAVRVAASVEPDANNRRLVVEADSGVHFTASELPLDGAQAARTTYVWLKNLPAGQYEVRVRVEQGHGPDLVESRGFAVMTAASGR
jgi:hypothetical protein